MATLNEEKKSSNGDKLTESPKEDGGFVGDLLTTLSDVQIGMKLEAKDAYGKWYIAKVVEVEKEDNEVLVHFEHWNSRYDEYIKIDSERLRILLPERRERLEKEREKHKKKMKVGDLIQARWEDGRMYFGKVLKVYKEEVDVLFDDGVEFRAPLSSIRKRSHISRSNLSRSSLQESDSSQTTPNPRMLRAQKRHRSEDSASQASFSSPPSSPVFIPSKKRQANMLDSDSSYSDSEFEERSTSLFQSRDSEEPLVREGPRRDLRKKFFKRLISGSSESDTSITPTPFKKRRVHNETWEGFQRRNSSSQGIPLRKEVSEQMDSVSVGQLSVDKVPHPPSQSIVESADDGSSKVEGNDSVKQGGGLFKKGKAMAVASRTRAQTKFENVSRKGDVKKQIKVAPKEMVIVWDHNEFKCKVTGCNKSFRKDSLLQSHVKHYHSIHKPGSKQRSTPGQSGKGTHDKNVKKESSVSPKAPQGKDGEGSKSPPPAVSPQTPNSTQQASKPTKTSPKSSSLKKKDTASAHKNLNSVSDGKDDSTPSRTRDASQDHPTTKFEATPKIPHSSSKGKHSQTSRPGKKSNIFSVAGPPLKIPMVEIKALPRESLSPRKLSSSSQVNVDESMFSANGETEASTTGSVAMTIEDGNDVVHCVCGDLTDEGFMIQCEECLCWQHGDCVHVSKNILPKKYVCCYCTNPPGLRNRLKYQFDKEWFGNGSLPSLPGAPKFPHGSAIKHTHQLTDTLYKLKKTLHSSKVKLQAASRINHPYLRQWAKECSHFENNDIISYLIAALIPISYLTECTESVEQVTPQTTNGDSRENPKEKEEDHWNSNEQGRVRENGGDSIHPLVNHTQAKELNVASLHLDPLPPSASPVHQAPSNGTAAESETNTLDPKTLKLAPLPPLRTESLQQLTTEILKKSIQLSVSTSARPSKTGADSTSTDDNSSVSSAPCCKETVNTLKTEEHDAINNEFGMQELSVFAVNPELKPTTTLERTLTSTATTLSPQVSSSPSKLVSSTRSAFTRVIAPPRSLGVTTLYPNTSPLKAVPSQVNTLSSSMSSPMDSVSLREFADAFVQGDTTNWYQRMRLLDHIENVQEKISKWMDSLEEQLEDLPLDDEAGNVEELLKHVQSTMSQLRQIQIANSA